MKYLEKIKGELYVSENVSISSKNIIIVSYKVNEEKLLENEEYEKLIELQKMKHFSMDGALKFWDNFDGGLYNKILQAKNNE